MDGTDLEEDLDAAIRALLLDAAASGTVFREMIEDHFDWRGLEAGRPGQASPGKRVRPLLALVAARAIGGDHAPALPAAAALEVIHNFTLILDDIMDGDTQRRSRPALWVRWGAGSATTAALGFYTLSFRALLDAVGGGGGRARARGRPGGAHGVHGDPGGAAARPRVRREARAPCGGFSGGRLRALLAHRPRGGSGGAHG